MGNRDDEKSARVDETPDLADEVWRLMSDLVLDNQRRREVAEAAGMSFGRTRAVRRVAKQPMSMSELASSLGMERPNATALVNELEDQGLLVRKAGPSDRRTRLVVATRKGKNLASRADKILRTPPKVLSDLSQDKLEMLREAFRGSSDAEG